MEDRFTALEKIDAHLHFNVINREVLEAARRRNFSLITVNVDFPEFGPVTDQLATALKLRGMHPQTVRFVGSFSLQNWQSKDWLANTLTQIESDRLKGALAVKIWKNIGMSVRDERGALLFLDDERLDPLFDYLEDNGIVVMMHQGEPKNCWLPIEQMNLRYDREYFRTHPQHHCYRRSDMPSYEQLLKARDRRLQRNRGLKTVQAHLASLEWSVRHLAKFLEAFPNAVVDTAARMNHLMYQAQHDREAVRRFFMTYRERILYATDFFITPQNSKIAAGQIEKIWLHDWRFLATDEPMRCEDFEGPFRGLALPEDVLHKIYRENAVRWLNIWEEIAEENIPF